MPRHMLLSLLILLLFTTACSQGAPANTPVPTLTALSLPDDITRFDVCAYLPGGIVAQALGRNLQANPQPFVFEEVIESSGCEFDAGQDPQGNLLYAYVAFTTLETYNAQPEADRQPAGDLGEGAFFIDGADARQLWVPVDQRYAIIVGMGEQANDSAAVDLAGQLLAKLP